MKIRLDDVMQSLSYHNETVYMYYIPLETVLMFRNGQIFGKPVDGITDMYDVNDRKHDFIALPDLGDRGRKKVMIAFVQSLPEGPLRDRAMDALDAENPGRELEEVLRRERRLLDWFSYRDGIYSEFSKTWCEETGLEWIE
ncbi:MAG: hypothetical protein IJG52_06025 [Lachnospiraceae bacterium]|nr:hypothetical protein [Lachnospiraceae bacterium]